MTPIFREFIIHPLVCGTEESARENSPLAAEEILTRCFLFELLNHLPDEGMLEIHVGGPAVCN